MNKLFRAIAKQAESARGGKVASALILTFILLCAPIFITLARLNPHELYGRYYGIDFNVFTEIESGDLPVEVTADADGYVESLRITGEITRNAGDYSFIVTNSIESVNLEGAALGLSGEYFFYADATSRLLLPVTMLPSWVIEERDWLEAFNYLALHNSYYPAFLFPTFALCVGIMVVWLAIFYFGIGFVMSWGRLLTHKLPFAGRMKIMVFSSTAPAIICFVLGFLIPIFHVLVFQVAVIYLAYMSQKRL